MATNKARFIITVEDEMAKEIEDYHYDNRYKDRTKAILALLRIGLDHVNEGSRASSNQKTTEEPKSQPSNVVTLEENPKSKKESSAV